MCRARIVASKCCCQEDGTSLNFRYILESKPKINVMVVKALDAKQDTTNVRGSLLGCAFAGNLDKLPRSSQCRVVWEARVGCCLISDIFINHHRTCCSESFDSSSVQFLIQLVVATCRVVTVRCHCRPAIQLSSSRASRKYGLLASLSCWPTKPTV